MAFNRKLLKSLGLNEEQVDAVAEAHSEAMAEVVTQRDGCRETAATVADIEYVPKASSL